MSTLELKTRRQHTGVALADGLRGEEEGLVAHDVCVMRERKGKERREKRMSKGSSFSSFHKNFLGQSQPHKMATFGDPIQKFSVWTSARARTPKRHLIS